MISTDYVKKKIERTIIASMPAALEESEADLALHGKGPFKFS